MPTPEIYVSTDIEADGPIPGPHSMLSLASAAYRIDGSVASTFTANLLTLPGATAHPATQAFWDKNPDAWAATRVNAVSAQDAMPRYLAWLRQLEGNPVFVGYPAAYDFMFVHWYLVRFTGDMPFSHSALDIKTFAMALLKTPYRETTKSVFPARWMNHNNPHTHVALDDALEQGAIFVAMLREHLGL